MQDARINPDTPGVLERSFAALSLTAAAAAAAGAVAGANGGDRAQLLALVFFVLLVGAGIGYRATRRYALQWRGHVAAAPGGVLPDSTAPRFSAAVPAPEGAPADAQDTRIADLAAAAEDLAAIAEQTTAYAERATGGAARFAQYALRLERDTTQITTRLDRLVADLQSISREPIPSTVTIALETLRACVGDIQATAESLRAGAADMTTAAQAQNEVGQGLAQASLVQDTTAGRLLAALSPANNAIVALRGQVAMIVRPARAGASPELEAPLR